MAKRVLVADDNPLVRRALCKLFEVEENYDICAEATDGEEAIDLALKYRPDLIILDLSMPILNGLEAGREIRKIMPHVPIILFTQHGNIGKAMFLIHHTVDRVVSKTDADALMEHVRSLAPV